MPGLKTLNQNSKVGQSDGKVAKVSDETDGH